MARRKKDKAAQPSDAIVASPTYRSRRPSRRGVFLVVVVVLLLILAACLFWYFKPAGDDKATNTAELRTLQTTLSSALSAADNQTIVYATTNLINGAKAGRFTIGNNDLGWYYNDRGNAYLNLYQFKSAIPDYEMAAKLNSSLKLPSLQEEFQARYETGERQQLIQPLHQLIQLESNSQDPMKGSVVAQYQADIQSIQHGKEISF